MSDEEHSDSEFYYPEEQETAERKASRRGRHFVKLKAKLKQAEIPRYRSVNTSRPRFDILP